MTTVARAYLPAAEGCKESDMTDQMSDAGLGVPDSQIASDFAEWQGERIKRTDRWVNAFFVVLVLCIAAAAVLVP